MFVVRLVFFPIKLGTKASGFGREGVSYAMEKMTEPRVLFLKT